MRLQCALCYTGKIHKNKNVVGTVEAAQSVRQFLAKVKKGSKKFREIISRTRYMGEDVTNLSIVNSFASITRTVLPPTNVIAHSLGSWNRYYLGNHIRDFLFQCRQNILKTKDRLSHFIDLDDSCFFCKNIGSRTNSRETFDHIFRTCPVIENTLLGFIARCRIVWPGENINFNEIYWYGVVHGNLCKSTHLLFDLFRYVIWTIRNKRVFITTDKVFEMVSSILLTVFVIKPGIRRAFLGAPHLSNFLQAMG
jgi:hypothetical protein